MATIANRPPARPTSRSGQAACQSPRSTGTQDAADGEAEENPHLGFRSARSRRSASVAPTGAGGPHGRSDLARCAPRPRAGFRGPLLRSDQISEVRGPLLSNLYTSE
jgi:hypothetical protein